MHSITYLVFRSALRFGVAFLGVSGCESKPSLSAPDVGAIRRKLEAEGDYKIVTQRFFERIRTTTQPEKLQSWANSLIRYKHFTEVTNISASSLPGYIKRIDPPKEPEVFVAPISQELGPHVTFDWGGGWGHWGVIAGTEDFRIPSTWNHTIEWIPGVYVFHSYP